jgi:hypothetical protein
MAERPQAGYKKDKQVEMRRGREDDSEWLIIDLCNDNGMFLFYFPHCDVTSRGDPNRIIRFGFRCIRSVTFLVRSSPISDFQLPSFHFNITHSLPSLPASDHLLFPPTIISHHLQHWVPICLLSTSITKFVLHAHLPHVPIHRIYSTDL